MTYYFHHREQSLLRKGKVMGLDQYLRASEYISRNDYSLPRKEDGSLDIRSNSLFNEVVDLIGGAEVLEPQGFSGLSVSIPVGYWRKANQIHQWFVDNCGEGEDDCRPYFVSRERLQELLDTCNKVLEVRTEEVAEELLPPQVGFFFGGYEIDEYYYQDLENTVEIITRCLNSKFDEFEYQASW